MASQNFNTSITTDDNVHDHPYKHPIYDVYLPIMYIIICVSGLLGNVLVIVVFVFYEKKKTLTEAFFLNLAVADILFLCSLPFLSYQLYDKWIFGDIMCKVIFGMYRVNLFTSMLTLTAITFDRFVSIVKGVKAQKYQQHKHKWGAAICASIWATALLLVVPQFIFLISKEDNDCQEDYGDMKKLRITVYSFQLVVGFFLPSSTMVICYSFILNTLIRSKSLQKKKSIRIILALVVVFIITQLPFNVTLLIFIIKDNEAELFEVLAVLESVAYLHACLNPILYFFVGSKFRNSFWKMLRGFGLGKGWEEPSHGTEGSSKVVSGSTHVEAFSLVQT
ncbi:C-X-C chemokine receptor type 6-like [Rana temporaria]|uniref:C-X-C chemokine receptor type 6-like n=1 Tax=Rana temporaria TaxID=8407 RepID=UPI001AAD8F07|nr:C-X-C chemokine receptor type 6-like [Rana temporaria]